MHTDSSLFVFGGGGEGEGELVHCILSAIVDKFLICIGKSRSDGPVEGTLDLIAMPSQELEVQVF